MNGLTDEVVSNSNNKNILFVSNFRTVIYIIGEQFEELVERNSSGSGSRKSKLRSELFVALTT
jgi:hypothetical protein